MLPPYFYADIMPMLGGRIDTSAAACFAAPLMLFAAAFSPLLDALSERPWRH